PINARRWNEAPRPVTRIAGSDISVLPAFCASFRRILILYRCKITRFRRYCQLDGIGKDSNHAVLVPNPGGARASRLEPGKACPRLRDWANDASADRAEGGSREGKLLHRA